MKPKASPAVQHSILSSLKLQPQPKRSVPSRARRAARACPMPSPAPLSLAPRGSSCTLRLTRLPFPGKKALHKHSVTVGATWQVCYLGHKECGRKPNQGEN